MSLSLVHEQHPRGRWTAWIFPILLLCTAYSLLGLTFTEQISHGELMHRCVLMDPKRARIWSVGNVEIGVAYLGVFAGMLFYFLGLYRKSRQHLSDLGLALVYLLGSFTLDYFCVQTFHPFQAMLVGDAVVMTFTVMVSRQLWFQRLLGVFVPIIFLTCGIGHFLEGLSYWHLTYPVNTPWTMVTADIGFAVLVNAGRFPAFIRGEDIVTQLAEEKTKRADLEMEIAARFRAEEALRKSEALLREEGERRQRFAYDVVFAASGGRLRLCADSTQMPAPLERSDGNFELTPVSISSIRIEIEAIAKQRSFPPERCFDISSAVGEALMNALLHGGGGQVQVTSDENRVQVRISDQGSGIDLDELPYATLRAGWSSKGTLGMGFSIMLEMSDHVDIMTSAEGTTIVLTVAHNPEEPDFFSA